MNDQDRQLVELITRQVIEQLTRRGLIGGAPDSSIQTPQADIRPPIGACTGDYSQFPELSGRAIGAAGPSAMGEPANALPSEPLPLTGIVTANQLQAAIDAASNGVARLDANARLTPLANDLARQNPDNVLRVAAVEAGGNAVQQQAKWLWWTEGQCPVISGLEARHAGQMIRFGAGHGSSSLSNVVRELAGAIAHKRAAGGLLFVKHAARAMCLANRCRSLRAVVGTCIEAVNQGINDLGMNVLVIEYPYQNQQTIYSMVEGFLRRWPTVPTMVERELADLHRCD